ncbi:hypothetical protein CETAM_12380 [Corynebacterium comes]|uniref:Capsular polysaccharide biosynthesis protein n=1 Tax=Corynebacterium comes TaxID=2675218 RepID=A0A6B8W124_9CORY|nr:hypothetical protein CETAM_12380 [Corynebacterium comes]
MSDSASTDPRPASGQVPASPTAPAPLDLGLIFAAFLRSIPVALVIALAAAGITFLVLSRMDPVYEVKTEVSLGAPADASLDPETRARLGSLYALIANDPATRDLVKDETGLDDPWVTATETAVPGVIEVATRAGSVGQARAAAESVIGSMILRSDAFSSQSARVRAEDAERRIVALQEQIDARRAEDPAAAVADLEDQIGLIRQENREFRPQQVQPFVLSQSDNDGDQVWPRVWSTTLVVAMLVFLLAQIPLTIWRLRRHRRADGLWLRMIGRRFEVDRELSAAGGGLTPLAEARTAAVLAHGGNVLVLGESDAGETFHSHGPGHLHQASWSASWWRELPPSDVQLGVVVVDKGERRANLASTAVERLVKSGVPTFVVVRSGKKRESSGGIENRDRS